IAAGHVTTAEANAKVHPPAANLEAVFAARAGPVGVAWGRGRDVLAGIGEVDAFVDDHGVSPPERLASESSERPARSCAMPGRTTASMPPGLARPTRFLRAARF